MVIFLIIIIIILIAIEITMIKNVYSFFFSILCIHSTAEILPLTAVDEADAEHFWTSMNSSAIAFLTKFVKIGGLSPSSLSVKVGGVYEMEPVVADKDFLFFLG